MKTKILTTLFTLMLSTSAMAGAGHSHGPDGSHQYPAKAVAQSTVMDKAASKINQLAKAGKIDASWQGVQANTIEQKLFGHNKEWVVMFSNKKIADNSKQKLYLFYTLSGLYIAANYSGK